MRNIDRYKEELEILKQQGVALYYSLMNAFSPDDCMKELLYDPPAECAGPTGLRYSDLPNFFESYQAWYSEALILLKQLLPDRVDDFKSYYEKPKSRSLISRTNYYIEDALQLTRDEASPLDELHDDLMPRKVDIDAALPRLKQQIAIVKAASKRFTSSLFNIQKLVQADLYDNELDAAKDLNNKKFHRAAGAIAGVVLERHLKEVCKEREIKLPSKNPTISVLSEALKDKDIIDIPIWRHISLLGDIRNECSHSKDVEPTKDRVNQLIQGVDTIIKTVY